MNLIAPILLGASLGSEDTPPAIKYGLLPSSIVCSIFHTYGNKRLEKIEKEDNTIVPIEILVEQKVNQFLGGLWAIVSLLNVGLTIYNPVQKDLYNDYLIAGHHLLRSASHYIMRAENPPRRKNVLRRRRDKLAEKLRDVDWNPFPSPEPIPIPTQYEAV